VGLISEEDFTNLQRIIFCMGWFSKLLKGSNRKNSGGRYHGKYGDDRYSDNHDNSAVITLSASCKKLTILSTYHVIF